ncbi:S9 family peptidase [Pannus brasiliensis CCIBt3594]|uniref:S9 family peptidase n=1 Tax=Pannus brasiliensis CCIBt3594 TaxID=1427578 RepID=A0AAW9QTJ6_9CHRO
MISSYGSWKSPITADRIVAESIALGAVTLDGEDIYWLEGRPGEGGRNVLVRLTADGQVTDITPAPFNVRTRVHEYGGGSYLVADGTIYFCHFPDQRIYRQEPGEEPIALTPAGSRRYADLILDRERDRLICICEDHSNPEREPVNSIVGVNLATGEARTLVSGEDFYSSPRLSPDGSRLAWISWNHPNMPWDGSFLWLADVTNEFSLSNARVIAGGESESVCEPRWSPDEQLYFSSDRENWWNLYCFTYEELIEPVYETDAEFAYPHWVFGLSTYAFASETEIITTYTRDGRWYLARIDTSEKTLQDIETPYTAISSLQVNGEKAVFIGGSFTEETGVISLDLATGETEVLKSSSNLEIDGAYLSVPTAIAFPTGNGQIAHAWYYPPKNPDYSAPSGELPPLLVKSHGGPTAAASSSLSLRVQYWTSRGFGYLDVNYGGSTGYGREYRQRLDGNWGIVDVEDCINGAKYLSEGGCVDGERLAISGGSAGGYTTLAALTFHDTFKAGASYYGISDLEALAADTHKFEARYLDRLVGRYPEEKEIYIRRSPIHFTDRLSVPVIFFQGLEDKVVPPNQAEMMVEVLKTKGLPVAYVPFEGEQHGFRRAETIKRALDGEFYFYSRVFGFTPADDIEAIEILNG